MSTYYGITSSTDSSGSSSIFSSLSSSSSSSSSSSASSTSSTDSSSELSWLFGSTSSSSSSVTDVTGINVSSLGDYSLIQSGTYRKLLDAYYSSKNTSSDTTDTSEKLNLSQASQDAQSLNSAVTKLMNTEVTEDNREELKEALKSVVDSYNSLIDSGSNVNDNSVLRNVLWMTQNTSANAAILSDLGITIDSDNKLSFDEDKFDSARLSSVKSAISGNDSFMGRLASRAVSVTTAAVNAVTESTASAYTSSGSTYSGTAVNSIIDSAT